MSQEVKTLFSFTGKVLGEAFETADGYAFHHFAEDVTISGFDSMDSAWDALWVFHEDYFEYMTN